MTSLWNGTARVRAYPSLSEEVKADVAVVGGGIFGLSAARFLVEAGKSVAVVESREVGAQVTGGSTGKVTSQHGLIYADLISRIGRERAQAYAVANQWAIEEVARLVAATGIACDLERRDAFLVTQSEEGGLRLDEEARAAVSLGLPASRVSDPPTPQPVHSGLQFENQAQFHPRKYVDGLAAAVSADGGRVFEHSTVVDVESRHPLRVVTKDGSVLADDVVIATNLPILDSGGFFARAFPRAHVGIAARLDAEAAPQQMFYCIDGTPHSYRSWNGEEGTYLVAIGDGFVPGQTADVERIARRLEDDVRRHWKIGDVTFRWMTEDYHSADRRPFAGKLTPLSRHLFTATGFGAWGLTNGTAAARVVADLILGHESRWSNVYDSSRLRSTVTSRLLRRNVHVAQHWVEGRFSAGERRSVSDLDNGEGAVLKTEDGKLAVYRDASGAFHSFSPYCPHMACLLSWNNLEKSWDCSCHGSRFEAKGALLHGPAKRGLDPKPLP